MAVSRRIGSTVAIDTVPLPERVEQGRLSLVRGRYLLTVGRRRMAVPVGPPLDEPTLKSLVGKDVAVAFSVSKPSVVVAIGRWPPQVPRTRPRPCYWWVCYIPAPALAKRVGVAIRQQFVIELVKEGVMSPSLGREITSAAAGRTR